MHNKSGVFERMLKSTGDLRVRHAPYETPRSARRRKLRRIRSVATSPVPAMTSASDSAATQTHISVATRPGANAAATDGRKPYARPPTSPPSVTQRIDHKQIHHPSRHRTWGEGRSTLTQHDSPQQRHTSRGRGGQRGAGSREQEAATPKHRDTHQGVRVGSRK